MANASELLAEPPSIERVDIIAAKAAGQRSASSVA